MKELIKQMIIDNIEKWTDTDIYAISLYVYDKRDNPCQPTVTLGYNTESRVQEVLNGNAPDVYGTPSGECEARWNYAFWLQNKYFVFGDGDTAEIVKDWILSRGFLYLEFDDPAWNKDATYRKVEKITKSFVSTLIEVVREIHEEKVLTQKYGKELPIIIHELEYYDAIGKQNIKANGKALVKEFAEWCGY